MNYRRSGFRVALHALDASDASRLVEQIAPDVIKIDARKLTDADTLRALAVQYGKRGTALLLKQVESTSVCRTTDGLGSILAQGYAWDQPAATVQPAYGEGIGSDVPLAFGSCANSRKDSNPSGPVSSTPF